MEKFQKTYGVPGYVELRLLLPLGKGKMVVNFAGGNLGGDGAAPAEFKTQDLVTQTIIEHSDYYKRGFIILISSISLGEVNEEASFVAASAKDLEVKEFTDLGAAKDYFVDTFGVDRKDILRRENVIAFGKEHGIEVKFTD